MSGAQAVGNSSYVSPTVVFEPLIGLATSFHYIRLGKSWELRERVATVAAYLFVSLQTALHGTPTSNGAIAGAAVCELERMRAVIKTTRGGGAQFVDYFLIPGLKKFAFISDKTTMHNFSILMNYYYHLVYF